MCWLEAYPSGYLRRRVPLGGVQIYTKGAIVRGYCLLRNCIARPGDRRLRACCTGPEPRLPRRVHGWIPLPGHRKEVQNHGGREGESAIGCFIWLMQLYYRTASFELLIWASSASGSTGTRSTSRLSSRGADTRRCLPRPPRERRTECDILRSM